MPFKNVKLPPGITPSKSVGECLAPLEGKQHGEKKNPYAPYRSKWEAEFAVQLAAECLPQWQRWYERVTFVLVPPSATQRGVRYTPDFTVWFDGVLQEVFEVKGWMRPGAAHKIKALAAMIAPVPVYVVRKEKTGEWSRERF